MWILFSPSEKKKTSHSQEIKTKKEFYKDFLTPNLEEVLNAYYAFLTSASDEELKKLLGVKNLNMNEIALLQNIFKIPLLKAILRYDGVAFRALDYEKLPLNSQEYIDRQVLIFSNLFGLLKANDLIPYYDLKQGNGFLGFESKKFYAKNKEKYLKFLDKEKEILDLRAGFYQQCLPIPSTFLVYEPIFIKNQKKVSHYAKYYRGILLRECANNNLKTLKELECLMIEGLNILDIKRDMANSKTLIYYEVTA
ncbi:YaaA family protein [Helicobacter mesocricetorum]|uniref:YaaA family protein n=1 Tax=Helicobacter mesocricetorum TaxID=87012 RepID=UPI000CF0BB3E|nr:YaaA family protein [Helicobacter mesocricetorum]